MTVWPSYSQWLDLAWFASLGAGALCLAVIAGCLYVKVRLLKARRAMWAARYQEIDEARTARSREDAIWAWHRRRAARVEVELREAIARAKTEPSALLAAIQAERHLQAVSN